MRRGGFCGKLKAKVAPEALWGDETLQEIASSHEVHPNRVFAWKRQAIDGLGEVFSNGVERREMGVRDHPALSVSRQCRWVSMSRSSLYYRPRGQPGADAAHR